MARVSKSLELPLGVAGALAVGMTYSAIADDPAYDARAGTLVPEHEIHKYIDISWLEALNKVSPVRFDTLLIASRPPSSHSIPHVDLRSDDHTKRRVFAVNFLLRGGALGHMVYHDEDKLMPTVTRSIKSRLGEEGRNSLGGALFRAPKDRGSITSYVFLQDKLTLIRTDVPHSLEIGQGVGNRVVFSLRSSQDQGISWDEALHKFKGIR